MFRPVGCRSLYYFYVWPYVRKISHKYKIKLESTNQLSGQKAHAQALKLESLNMYYLSAFMKYIALVQYSICIFEERPHQPDHFHQTH